MQVRLLAVLLVVAACGDNTICHVAADALTDAPIDAPVDATPDAIPDARPDAAPDAMPDAIPDAGIGESLGDFCTPGQPGACEAPFVCSQTFGVCTLSCNILPGGGDHAFCQTFDFAGVCSRSNGIEGRCFVGCISNATCPTGTLCTRAVDPPQGSIYQKYCSRF